MKCKICQNNTETLFHPSLQKHYHVCENCELISLDATLIVNLEREKAQYDNHQNSLENEGYVQMFENFLNFFWDSLTYKDTLALDFGSGPTPVLAELMKRRGTKVECYDKFYQPQARLERNRYDLITSTEVFEHLDNPLQTLTLLTKCLKPKGLIALMTLFHPNNNEQFIQWWYPRDPTHITFYTLKTLELLGEKCGLRVIKNDGKRIVVFQKQ